MQTPIITANDCEGAGETFHVYHPDDLKVTASTGTTAEAKVNDGTGAANKPQSYFPSQCHLTVSSQLHLEALMHSISRVFTTQTAFRAENALSRKHLCEFAMLEAEFVVDRLEDLVALVEAMVKRSWNEVRELHEFTHPIGESWRDVVDSALQHDFMKISYDDAVRELQGELGSLLLSLSRSLSSRGVIFSHSSYNVFFLEMSLQENDSRFPFTGVKISKLSMKICSWN